MKAHAKAGAPAMDGAQLVRYLEIPLRRPKHFFITLTLVFVATMAIGLMQAKRYKSSTLIMVESEKVPEAFMPKMATDRAGRRLQTIRQEMLSRTRLETVIRQIDPYGTGAENLSATIERMRNAVAISVRGNDAFVIEFTHTDPQKAQAVASRVAALFIEEAARDREKQVNEAYEFFDSELGDLRTQLEERERTLRRYKERHMGTLPEQTPANLATLQRLQLEYQTTSENQRAATQRLAQLESNPTQVVVAPGSELDQARSQLHTLRARYTDEHPDVRAALTRVNSLEGGNGAGKEERDKAEKEEAAMSAQMELARNDVARLTNRLNDLDQSIASFQARVEQAPRTEQEITTLSRDFQKLNERYLNLLNKKLEAQMNAKMEQRWKGEQFRILDPANLPERPFWPRTDLFVVLGLVLGTGLGLLVAIGTDLVDGTIKTAREVEQLLPFPVLAVIPTFDPRGSIFAGAGRFGWPGHEAPALPGSDHELAGRG
jgi:polysaccharide chain length determinant protein (PEP-CTERM system associated)